MSNLTVDDILTSSGKYPARAKDKSCTDIVKGKAKTLVERVNALLKDLGVSKTEASSGFRTPASNAGVANAAKRSLHMSGEAVDLIDDAQQTLAYAIMARPDLLKKHKLWLEHPENTKGANTNWCHLDMSETRKDRPIRVFRPAI